MCKFSCNCQFHIKYNFYLYLKFHIKYTLCVELNIQPLAKYQNAWCVMPPVPVTQLVQEHTTVLEGDVVI